MSSLVLSDIAARWRDDRTSASERVAAVSQDRAHRALNVAVAIVGLVITAPLFLVIGLLIRVTSNGPILYRQPRVGLNRRGSGRDAKDRRRAVDVGGKPFIIYKFRTMRVTDNTGDVQVWASPSDPRVTRVGRILRKFRLDELPQLINVLLGDMNVVGPRPEQPRIFAELRTQVHEYAERQRVRPGITGWAQINQHYDSCVDDVRTKVALDLDYIARRSLAHDMRIMLLTAPTVVLQRGAW
jgi:lipopolysaccharide/colanic/teichoic acid biosynthesis glycosyltransferase